MPELSVAVLMPGAAPAAPRQPAPSRPPAERESVRDTAPGARDERAPRREPADRRPGEAAERAEPRERSASETAGGAQPTREDEPVDAPVAAAQAAEPDTRAARDRPFAALLATQMTSHVERPEALAHNELAASVHAAVAATPAAVTLPTGNALPPAGLSDALQRHASQAAGDARAGAGHGREAAADAPRHGPQVPAELPADVVELKSKAGADSLRAFPEQLAQQAGKAGDGAGEPLVQAQALAARSGGEAVTGAAGARATVTVEAPVGSSRWNQAFGERVSWLVRDGSQVASMRLDPPQLGPVDVRVSVSNGEASLSFVAHHGQVRDAIQDALPRLREMLGEQGLSLGEVDVSGRERRGEGGGSERAGDEGGSSERAAAENLGGDGGDGVDGEGGAIAGLAGRVRQGLLDHYV